MHHPDTYERKLTGAKGELITTRTLTLSADGNTLTEKTDQTRTDGKPRSVTLTYQRADGQKGLIGRWKAQSYKSTVPAERYIERFGANGIKYTDAVGTTITAPLMLVGLLTSLLFCLWHYFRQVRETSEQVLSTGIRLVLGGYVPLWFGFTLVRRVLNG